MENIGNKWSEREPVAFFVLFCVVFLIQNRTGGTGGCGEAECRAESMA